MPGQISLPLLTQVNLSITLFHLRRLQDVRPIPPPSPWLCASVAALRLFFEDEHEDDDEHDSQSDYFPLNSALRFSRKAFMPSF
jgi:hypothetical protein